MDAKQLGHIVTQLTIAISGFSRSHVDRLVEPGLPYDDFKPKNGERRVLRVDVHDLKAWARGRKR